MQSNDTNQRDKRDPGAAQDVSQPRGRYRLALLDLDGTLWRGTDVIQGAPEFVERLRDEGIRPVYFTNNASRTPEHVAELLRGMGFSAEPDEVCTSAQAAAHLLKKRVPEAGVVAYVGAEGLREALLSEGFDARRADGEQLREPWVNETVAAVVGLDQKVNYMDLALVSRVARRLGWFVLTNPDVRLPVEDGFLPGNGSIGAFVATASGTEPLVTGKPDPSFVAYALERYGVPADFAVIIGDNLQTDILAGKHAGIHSILVRTGITPDPGVGDPTPDEIVDSV